MITFIKTFFTNTKNILMSIGTVLIGGYVLKQKYATKKAKRDLKDLKQDIDKTNVVIAKENAKAKEKAKDLEHSTEVDSLLELNKIKEKVQEELQETKDSIKESKPGKKTRIKI